MDSSFESPVVTSKIVCPYINTNFSNVSIVSSIATGLDNSIFLLNTAYKKLFSIAEIFYSELDLTNSNILPKTEILPIACTLTLTALSNTET
jgi:hypothetical protein